MNTVVRVLTIAIQPNKEGKVLAPKEILRDSGSKPEPQIGLQAVDKKPFLKVGT
jgi:hypothetical protein